MAELPVVIIASDSEQRAVLQVLVDGTSVARSVHTSATFPVAAADPAVRKIQAANPAVVLVDIPIDNPALALRAIELLQQELPDSALFAIGSMFALSNAISKKREGGNQSPSRISLTCAIRA